MTTGFLTPELLGIFTLDNMFALFFGGFVGMLIGALPGLGQTIALTMVLPLTYTMEPVAAILLVLSCYQSSGYGGAISSVTLAIPGTPSAVATVLDGNALSKKGKPGRALAYSLVSSAIGGILSAIALIYLARPLATAAMKFSEPEYFLICVIGLIISVLVICKDFLFGLVAMGCGMLAGTIGIDLQSSVKRFTFGQMELNGGMEITAVVVGTFALTEILKIVLEVRKPALKVDNKDLSTHLSLRDIWASMPTMVGTSVLGTLIGCVPGLGGPTASWLGYAGAKKLTRDKTPFGEGNVDGIAGPEAANNAAVGGNMIPLLIFGLPNNAMMAVVMGAFMIQGVAPGSRFFTDDPLMANYILFGFLLTSVVMWIVGRILTPTFARFLTIPNRILFPVVLLLSLLGTYASSKLYFNLWLTLGIGIIFCVLDKVGFSIPTFVLAYVLGPQAEVYLRRSLRMYDSMSVFVTRPLSLIMLIGIVAVLIGAFIVKVRQSRKAVTESVA